MPHPVEILQAFEVRLSCLTCVDNTLHKQDAAELFSAFHSLKGSIEQNVAIPACRKKLLANRIDIVTERVSSLKGPLRFSVALLAVLRDIILECRVMFHMASPRELALHAAREAGKTLLPSYGDLVDEALRAFEALVCNDITVIVANMLQGTAHAEKFPATMSVESLCPKADASLALDMAGCAYGGICQCDKYILPPERIPAALRPAYTAEKGLLELPGDIRLWCGNTEAGLTLAFAGTRLDALGTMLADLEQLTMPSLHYLAAAGIVQLFLQQKCDHVVVTGHSLGGGLAQFALAAQQAEKTSILGIGFNAAGLSMTSLAHLGDERLSASRDKIIHFSTLLDPVSRVGGILGGRRALPIAAGRVPLHAWQDLRACMDVYLGQNARETLAAASENNVPIEACALPAPGYMGLKEARHVYLTCPTDRKLSWGCFGRGYTHGDQAELLYTGTIAKEWALALNPYTDDAVQHPSFQAGVANTVNGTCHTLANRLLLLSQDEKADVSTSIDDAYSVAIFGKYGSGLLPASRLLDKSFMLAKEHAPLEEAALWNAQKRLWNPYVDELAAWVRIAEEHVKISIRPLLSANPDLAALAVGVITSYAAERNSAYERNVDGSKDTPPTPQQAQAFMREIKALCKKYVHALLESLGVLGKLSPALVKEFTIFIDNFIDSVGNGLVQA